MNRIKELRVERGASQSDIAQIINKTDTTVGLYERGLRDPNSEVWIILANYFHVSLDYLMGNTDRRTFDLDEDDLRFTYFKEMQGLTNQEIREALKFYKQVRYGK